MQCWNFW